MKYVRTEDDAPVVSGSGDNVESTDRSITYEGEGKTSVGGGEKRGGLIKKAKGGSASSASKRADGIAQRGKTRGTIVMCKGGMYK